MIRFVARMIVLMIFNAAVVLGAATFIRGVSLSGDIKDSLLVGAILTLLNLAVRPVLKLFFGPVIVLTLGLGILLVNALVLVLLDFISESFTIQGLWPLLWASIALGVANIIFDLGTKKD